MSSHPSHPSSPPHSTSQNHSTPFQKLVPIKSFYLYHHASYDDDILIPNMVADWSAISPKLELGAFEPKTSRIILLQANEQDGVSFCWDTILEDCLVSEDLPAGLPNEILPAQIIKIVVSERLIVPGHSSSDPTILKLSILYDPVPSLKCTRPTQQPRAVKKRCSQPAGHSEDFPIFISDNDDDVQAKSSSKIIHHELVCHIDLTRVAPSQSPLQSQHSPPPHQPSHPPIVKLTYVALHQFIHGDQKTNLASPPSPEPVDTSQKIESAYEKLARLVADDTAGVFTDPEDVDYVPSQDRADEMSDGDDIIGLMGSDGTESDDSDEFSRFSEDSRGGGGSTKDRARKEKRSSVRSSKSPPRARAENAHELSLMNAGLQDHVKQLKRKVSKLKGACRQHKKDKKLMAEFHRKRVMTIKRLKRQLHKKEDKILEFQTTYKIAFDELETRIKQTLKEEIPKKLLVAEEEIRFKRMAMEKIKVLMKIQELVILDLKKMVLKLEIEKIELGNNNHNN